MSTVDTSTLLARITSALTLGTRTDVGTLMRPKSGKEKGDLASESYYIETTESADATFSCSFVEFDGMGDYLLFDQHEDAWKQVLRLANNSTVLLVIYCHGWKNNCQSADVLRFNTFLRQLASTKAVRADGTRVHGVFLAWRGAAMKPDLSGADDRALEEELRKNFGQSIVSSQWAQWLPGWLAFVPSQLTYWRRKSAAENDVSGPPISRTIFSLGYSLKRHQTEGRNHRVVLIGHSLGALMIEQSLANASMSKVMADWPWFTKTTPPGQDAMVLPFDLVLLLNSAAPSIYAKEMRDFLAADYAVRKASGFPRPERPVIISVTSEADRATGVIHRIGNVFSPLSPKMQREYYDPHTGKRVPQSYFYSRTPGHNPLLINRHIKTASAPSVNPPKDPFEANMQPAPNAPWIFYTSARKAGELGQAWELVRSSQQPGDPTLGESWRDKANYWIISVPGTLIRNHGDIWSPQVMEMIVALWRMAEAAGVTQKSSAPIASPQANAFQSPRQI
jgi:hypothetical protein